jgi:serine protease Do
VKNSIASVYIHRGDFGWPESSEPETLSGINVTSDGMIAVPVFDVSKDTQVTAVLPDNQIFPARVIGIDRLTGVAFLQVEKNDLSVLSQGFSQDLQVSEGLLAVWSPGSVSMPRARSTSLVSRSLVPPSLSQEYEFGSLNGFLDLDYTDWSSAQLGAAVVNRDGAIVGFVTRFDKETKVLRSEDLKMAIDNVLDDRKITWPALTISYRILGEEQTKLLNMPKKYGILVTAGSGKLLKNDFVYEIDGQALSVDNDFQQVLLRKKPGEIARFKLLRNGQEFNQDVRL